MYLISPRTCHRIVGYFEEQAVVSYTEYLEEVEQGRVENVKAPEIAINYWNLSPDARLIDVIKVVREDEAGHRDVNHNFVDDLDKKTNHQNKTVEVKEKEVNITAQKK